MIILFSSSFLIYNYFFIKTKRSVFKPMHNRSNNKKQNKWKCSCVFGSVGFVCVSVCLCVCRGGGGEGGLSVYLPVSAGVCVEISGFNARL